MMRTTISLPEDLIQRLKIMAARRQISMGALIREAAEEKVSETRPRPKSLGAGESDYTDTSRLMGETRPVPRS